MPVGLARETTAVVFGLLGSLVGLILTPYVTTRPARAAARRTREAPAEILLTSIVGLILGLIVGALLSAPLSSLPDALGQWMPTVIAIIFAYLGIIIFGYRALDIFNLARQLFRDDTRYDDRFADQPIFNEVQILVDSSAIIDGRLLDISKTGFLSGHLLVPSFISARASAHRRRQRPAAPRPWPPRPGHPGADEDARAKRQSTSSTSTWKACARSITS